MHWFTGSSTEGLPFIHDSFRPNLKAVHHRPKPPRPDKPADTTASSNNNGSSTARSVNGRDVSVEAVDTETLKLPAVQRGAAVSNGPLSSRTGAGRVENGKEPASFTSYMHRYKACARLKGFSPSRSYCSTRMRSTSSDNPHSHDPELTHPQLSAKDALVTTAIPLSNLRLDPKSEPPKADPSSGEASSPSESQDNLPREAAPETIEASTLEKQLEEKLKRDGSVNDGMTTPGPHTHRQRGRRSRRGERRGGRGGSGAGRPLGDIVSPQRMQELLNQRKEHTLPYTYYRTTLGEEGPPLETADSDSPELASLE